MARTTRVPYFHDSGWLNFEGTSRAPPSDSIVPRPHLRGLGLGTRLITVTLRVVRFRIDTHYCDISRPIFHAHPSVNVLMTGMQCLSLSLPLSVSLSVPPPPSPPSSCRAGSLSLGYAVNKYEQLATKRLVGSFTVTVSACLFNTSIPKSGDKSDPII